MEGPLSLQIDAGSMIILTLILTLLDYLINDWSNSTKDTKEKELKVQLPKRINLNYRSNSKKNIEEDLEVQLPSLSTPTKVIEEEELKVQLAIRIGEETPIFSRYLEAKYRQKLMTGVRRRLDKQF